MVETVTLLRQVKQVKKLWSTRMHVVYVKKLSTVRNKKEQVE